MSSSSQDGRRAPRVLGTVAAVHVAVFFAATTWAFGGNADWVRAPLSWLGSLGALITLVGLLAPDSVLPNRRQALRWLWPVALFNLVSLLALLSPSFREMASDGDKLLVSQAVPVWKPSAAVPGEVVPLLWIFDAAYLSCFNLAFLVGRRRILRGLLLFAVGNTVVLAIFGTLQKLTHAPGLYFGRIASPQDYFFATFVYHNHWGAFAILMCAAAAGITWHYGREGGRRGFLQSLGFAGLAALLLIALTVPLSGSRSCTVLLLIMLVAMFCHWIAALRRRRRREGAPVGLPLAAAGVAIVAALAATWTIDREMIVYRLNKTELQYADLRAHGVGARATLYRDTWRMAEDRLWFGWGMGSYPYVFTLYDTIEPNRKDHLPIFYHDAHNDWLQGIAEHGLVGVALLALAAIVPLQGVRRTRRFGGLPGYLLTGCCVVLLYAWVEFPFGNVAVVLSWWLCFFTALGYARLSGRPPDRRRNGGDFPSAAPAL